MGLRMIGKGQMDVKQELGLKSIDFSRFIFYLFSLDILIHRFRTVDFNFHQLSEPDELSHGCHTDSDMIVDGITDMLAHTTAHATLCGYLKPQGRKIHR